MFLVALCALPSIHHGHSQASGLIGSSTSSGPTSSDYEVVCGEGLSVSSSPHSKCERSSDGNSVYKNVPECLGEYIYMITWIDNHYLEDKLYRHVGTLLKQYQPMETMKQ